MTEDDIKERIKTRQTAQLSHEAQKELAEYIQEAENMLEAVCVASHGKPDWKAFHEEVERVWLGLGDLRVSWLCLPDETIEGGRE